MVSEGRRNYFLSKFYGNVDFNKFYFILNLVCSMNGNFLNKKEIDHRNELFRTYMFGALSRAISSIKIDKRDDEYVKKVNEKYMFFREKAKQELERLTIKDYEKYIAPYLLTLKEEEVEEIVEEFDKSYIIGVFH